MPAFTPMPGMSGLEQLQGLMQDELSRYPQVRQQAQQGVQDTGGALTQALGTNPISQNDMDASSLAAMTEGLSKGGPNFFSSLGSGVSSYEQALQRQQQYKQQLI